MPPPNRQTFTSQHFERRLNALRSKIELLPEEQRPEFQASLDEAEQQHMRMQRNCANIWDMVGDLKLMETYTKFHVEACRREVQEIRRGHLVNRKQ